MLIFDEVEAYKNCAIFRPPLVSYPSLDGKVNISFLAEQ